MERSVSFRSDQNIWITSVGVFNCCKCFSVREAGLIDFYFFFMLCFGAALCYFILSDAFSFFSMIFSVSTVRFMRIYFVWR